MEKMSKSPKYLKKRLNLGFSWRWNQIGIEIAHDLEAIPGLMTLWIMTGTNAVFYFSIFPFS